MSLYRGHETLHVEDDPMGAPLPWSQAVRAGYTFLADTSTGLGAVRAGYKAVVVPSPQKRLAPSAAG